MLLDRKSQWFQGLSPVLEAEKFEKLWDMLELSEEEVYPPKESIFSAFQATPLEQVKVVLLGQDPYHGEGQANGLAFSVSRGVKLPPSLRNIYKELQEDCGISMPEHGDLTSWAKQGVLLLNTSLTVEMGKAGSHRNLGWEEVTDSAISLVNQKENPVVFILWGNHAHAKQSLITNPLHLILTSAHPSPLSAYRGFFGCKHFSKTNEFLKNNGETPIQWDISS